MTYFAQARLGAARRPHVSRPHRSRGPARVGAALLGALALSACASPDPDAFAYDPYEESNREFHEFNKGLDTVALRPAAYVYKEVTPTLFRHLLGNGLDMLDMPAIFVNRLLQGEFELAGYALARFGINAVVGGVLLDPATEVGLPKENTDLGLTFASWGVEEGPYVELPLLGPATTRDAVGRVAEIFLDPFNLITGVPALDVLGPGFAVLGIVELRASNYGLIDEAYYQSEDSYVTTRSAYLQNRRRAEAGGPTADTLPDVFAD